MAKDMKISIGADQVMYSNISKSKDGYNSARLVAKINEKEYMSVSYEWEGKSVPDFAMNLMSFMQANEIEFSAEKMCSKCKKAASKCDCNDGKEEKPNKGPRDNKEKKDKAGDGGQVHCKNCKKTKDKCDCGDWQPVPYKTKDQKENKAK